MRRDLVSAVLVAMLTLMVVACGDDDGEGGETLTAEEFVEQANVSVRNPRPISTFSPKRPFLFGRRRPEHNERASWKRWH
jgi:hypothetical protein